MLRIPTLLAALLSFTTPAAASTCGEEASRAERTWSLPAGLLNAIGEVESGRWDRGRRAAWPFSVNAGGDGRQFATVAEAIGQVVAWQARGISSIDVGCFQVNLMYHPDAFRTLEEAFDPATNAREAARFLRTLRSTSTGWEEATARYHSATPDRGGPYSQAVLAVWLGTPPPPPGPPPTPTAPNLLSPALLAAGVHLPVVEIRQPGTTPRPLPRNRPQRS